MKEVDRDKANKFGYTLGYMFGVVVWACLTAFIIAATIKLIIWIF